MLPWLGVVVLTSLVGCGDPVPTNDLPAAPRKASVALEAEPEAPAADPYYYNPAGKRDPFQTFLSSQARAGETLGADAPPLQRWDVDKFLLRGIIWDTSAPTALLVDPEGVGHVVRVGTYVGRNWGKVSSISADGLVVTEEYQTLDGELVVNPVAIRFPQGTPKP
jgi:type IV pilus assembly protein PilP